MTKQKSSFYIEQEKLIDMVERLQRKEPNAEVEIYNAFRDKVYGHIFKITRFDTNAADELINEVFMEIFRTVHKLKNPAAFVSWVNIIVEHQVAAYARKELRRYALIEKLIAETKVIKMSREENGLYLAEIFSQLPKKQARAVYLYYIRDLPIAEIAEIEKIPVGTVKSRLFYGKRALKTILDKA